MTDQHTENPLGNFYGPNAGYVLELYEQFQLDPLSVDEASRSFFQQWMPPADGLLTNGSARSAMPEINSASATIGDLQKAVGVANLAQSIREYGHLAAQLDPLGSAPPDDPSLHLDFHGLTEDDLRRLPATLVGGPVAERTETALDAIADLRRVYSNTIGHDYDHLRIPEVREWLRHAAEADPYGPEANPIDEERLLKRLTQVETFEKFLHSKFPGKTRFSIEGLDVLVPMLDEIILHCAKEHIHEILLGMAHRGRLNVLAHILEKPYGRS